MSYTNESEVAAPLVEADQIVESVEAGQFVEPVTETKPKKTKKSGAKTGKTSKRKSAEATPTPEGETTPEGEPAAKKPRKKRGEVVGDYIFTLRKAPRRRAVQVALGIQGLEKYRPVEEAVDEIHKGVERTMDLLFTIAAENTIRDKRATILPRDILGAIRTHSNYRDGDLIPRLVELIVEDAELARVVKAKAPNVLSINL